MSLGGTFSPIDTSPPLTSPTSRPDDLAPADELVQRSAACADAGDFRQAIDLLTSANRQRRSAGIERRIVQYRRRAFRALDRGEPQGEWPRPLDDPFPDVAGLPELTPAELTNDRIGGGILHHGGVIVRGLAPPEQADRFVHSIDQAFDAYDTAAVSGEPSPWFQPFNGSIEKMADRRAWIRKSAALWAADCPPALFEIFEFMYSAGLPALVQEHFGEPVALSVNKLTLRRVAGTQAATWHQDGAFLGEGVRALNLWITFTACGGDIHDTPALDVVPERVDDIIEPGGPKAWVEHAISPVRVKERFGDRIQRPSFAAGDAMLFDERFLHKSGISRGMTNDRYTVETWFFALSSFPPNYHGLLV